MIVSIQDQFATGLALKRNSGYLKEYGGESGFTRVSGLVREHKVDKASDDIRNSARTNRAKVPADYVTAHISKILQHVYGGTGPKFCRFHKRGLLGLRPVEHTKLRSHTSVRRARQLNVRYSSTSDFIKLMILKYILLANPNPSIAILFLLPYRSL